MINHYETLNIAENASGEEIKKVYRQLSLKNHPDRVRNRLRAIYEQVSEEEVQAEIARVTPIFVRVTTAYNVLIDPTQRRIHDKNLREQREGHTARSIDGLPNFFSMDTEAMFADMPEGINVGAPTLRRIMAEMDAELQRIIDKAHVNSRYRKIAAVLVDLKAKTAEYREIYLPDLPTAAHIKTADYNEYLIQTLIAIQQAIDTKEPGKHRGVLRGTPILRELTMLMVALFRLLTFIFQKFYKYLRQDYTPVYRNGLFQGLFKPTPTRTLTNLQKMQEALRLQQSLAENDLEGTRPGGKTCSEVYMDFEFDRPIFGR